jgi:hypothetical protein
MVKRCLGFLGKFGISHISPFLEEEDVTRNFQQCSKNHQITYTLSAEV